MEDVKKFLTHDCIWLLRKLQPGQRGLWGKMDAQQMVEHLVLITRVANGKIPVKPHEQPKERLEKMRAFLLTDLPFSTNIRVDGIPEEPEPYHCESLAAAIDKLQAELERMISVYESDPSLILIHPGFGEMDYDLQMRYMKKHMHHHLKQFGLVD